MNEKPIASLDPAELRRRAEQRLERQRSEAGAPQAAQDTQRLLHELQVHQLELEMQNEELRAAQAAVAAALDRYTHFHEFAPTGFLCLGREGTIRQLNLTGARLLGLPRDQLVGAGFGPFVVDADRAVFNAFFAAVFAAQTKQACEVRLQATGQPPLTVAIEATLSADGQECRALLVHITARQRMEEKLRFRDRAIDSATQGISISDHRLPCHPVIYVNRGFEQMTGYTRAELVGKNIELLQGPDTDAKTIAVLRAAVAEGRSLETEILNYRKDGTPFWNRLAIAPVRSPGSLVTHYVAIRSDVSERRQAEAALRENEMRLRLALKAARMGTWDWDLQTNHVAWSPRHEALWGYAPGEFPCTLDGYESRLHPDDVEGARRAGQKAMDEHSDYAHEYRVLWPDGTVRWMAARGQVFNSSDGQPARMMGVVTDITEHKQTETTLRESEGKLRVVLDATPFPIAVVDLRDDRIQFWSRSALSLFGHTAPTTPEWYQMAYPDPDYRREVIQRWKPFLETARQSNRAVNTGEYRVTCKDGSVRICELHAAFLSNDLIVTFNDVTERKQAEASIQASLEEKRVLLREIHHRVKNNMQVMSSLLTLQAKAIMDPEVRELFQVAQRRIKAMALVHARIYQSANLAGIDFANYVRDLTRNLRLSFDGGVAGVHLKVTMEGVSLNLEQAMPCALIVNELVTNALKYAFPAGSERPDQEIHVSLERQAGQWVLTVRDNGIGLPPAIEIGGSPGLGLNLVEMLIRQLEGEVAVKREAGTAFTVTFAVG